MNSKLFIGHVSHNRYEPTPHSFEYPLYVYGLDLDELHDIDRKNPLFGYNRKRLTTISDRDYLDHSGKSIKDKLFKQLELNQIKTPVSKVMLITSARYLNYVFNPVSFYYCFSKSGEIVCLVAEINNTYGEKHLYVLQKPGSSLENGFLRYSAAKAFHVSPFNRIEGTYQFYFSDLNDSLTIRIELMIDQRKVFDAELRGEAVPFNFFNQVKLILKHPVVPHLSIPRIYWEAAKLYFRKKLVFNEKPVPFSPATIRKNPPTRMQRACMGLLLKIFGKISIGSLEVSFPDGKSVRFGRVDSNINAYVHIRDYRFFSRVILNGDIGLGESYMENEWDTPNLVDVFKVFIENRKLFADGNFTTAIFSRIMEKVANRNHLNSIFGSKKNIKYHYDLGNDFYQTFLDESMTYSCGIFKSDGDTLETAQQNKLNTMIRKAEIRKEDHVLEIGCGWGSFAIAAAKQTGCRVTGITISKAQHEMASARVEKAGLSDLVTIVLKDYRHMTGFFDKIVSIEMLEAVGHQYFGTFFKTCDHLLKPNGRVVLQTITIPDHRYENYRKERDWIQKHIFPGGFLPSFTVLCQAISGHTQFIVEHLENIGVNYARTLREWRLRFISQTDQIANMGFDKAFIRKWIYYLSCCEAGFERRVLGDIQMVLRRAKSESKDG
jgi:cyclopropane-fatty-acyl-phospholipid synthase